MSHHKTASNGASARHASALSSLQPVDVAPFKRPSGLVFVWFTVLITWLISLLPWRLWQPAPDLLLLVIAFWCLHEPRRINMGVAFAFGLLMDVHDASLLGVQAFAYTLVAYGVQLLSRRMFRFNVVIQAIHLVPVFVVSLGLARLAHVWLAGEWAGWAWLWSALFTVALWPLADVLLLIPQRRLDETDAGAV